ncbi:hypothetical protein NVIRENTERO_03165 [Sodalis praecaptivus]|nr:hypothetical protein NVIRENTERO_03165 [Sodalis praecaptivus]
MIFALIKIRLLQTFAFRAEFLLWLLTLNLPLIMLFFLASGRPRRHVSWLHARRFQSLLSRRAGHHHLDQLQQRVENE